MSETAVRWIAIDGEHYRTQKRVRDLDTSWMADAECANTDPTLFFDNQRVATAKAVCAECSVASACLEYGMAQQPPPQYFGMWGGHTADEMRTVARRRKSERERERSRERRMSA